MDLLTAPALHTWPHGFTTRHGGVSTGARASLDLALRPGAESEAIQNWARVADAVGFDPAHVVLLHQIHGADVLEAHVPTGPTAVLGLADAVITDVPGLLLAIRTADCVPVLLAAPGAVGAAHAGWRGVAAGVVPNAVHALCRLAGCAPDAVIAAIGPHIGPDAYEVGPEVVAGIARSVPEAVFVRTGRSRPHVDLRAAVVHQLAEAGVRTIDHVDRCTSRDPAFFSHRRDGEGTGRLASVIGMPG